MEELARIRNERGWSQQRLADESGVNKATINQTERGRRSPNVETLAKLARALGVEVADFFPKAEPSLFEPDDEAKQAAEILRKASDKELDELHDELHDQMDELRGQGKKDGPEYARVMIGILRVLQEKKDRERSRALA